MKKVSGRLERISLLILPLLLRKRLGGAFSLKNLWRLVPLTLVFALLGVLYLPNGNASAQVQSGQVSGSLPPVADPNGFEIIINLPEMKLYLYRYGLPFKEYPIGIGNVVSPSLLGRTEIINRVAHPTYYPPDWYSRGLSPIPPGPDNPVGTRWLGLGWPGYGIHGTNRPESIGTAASAGCIRMYNEHVEELAEYVSIGTPVTFIYETITAWTDPITRRPYMKVVPDLYNLGTNTVANAQRVFAEQGLNVPDLDIAALEMLLTEASGQPQPIPLQLGVTLNDNVLANAGYTLGTRDLVSLVALSNALGEELPWRRQGGDVLVHGRSVNGAVVVSGKPYAPPAAAAAALGLVHMPAAPGTDEPEAYYAARVVRDGTQLPLRGFIDRDQLLLPVKEFAAEFGVDLQWDPELGAAVWDGRPLFGGRIIFDRAYMPHDRLAALLGVTIHWAPGDTVGEIIVPRVVAGDEIAEAFWQDGELYIPVRFFAEARGLLFSWDPIAELVYIEGRAFPGVVRGNRVYTALSYLSELWGGQASWRIEGDVVYID